jgi:hypothetical protein
VLRQLFKKPGARFAGKTADAASFDLRLNRLDVCRMAVAEAVYADAADNIDKGVAVDIGNCAAARLLYGNAGEQGKILQSGRQMLIFTLAQRLTRRPRNDRFDRGLLLSRLPDRVFH